MSRFWIQEHGQPRDGFFIVVAAAAHVTHPSGKIGNRDELLVQPGEVGDETQVHEAGGAFIARRGLGRKFFVFVCDGIHKMVVLYPVGGRTGLAIP